MTSLSLPHSRISALGATTATLVLLLVLCLVPTAARAATAMQAPDSPVADEGFPGSMSWSPVGGYLAVGDSTGGVEVFDQDAATGTLTEDSASPIAGPTSGGVPLIAWDSTGRFLVVADQGSNQIEVLDSEDVFEPVATSPTTEGGASGSIQQISADPDAGLIAVLDSNSETITTYAIDPNSGALTEEASMPIAAGEQNELAWSPTGNLLAVATDPDGMFSFANGAPSEIYGPTTIQAFLVDQVSGALTPDSTTTGDLVGVNSMSFSADGTMLATGNNSTSVDVFGVDDSSGALAEMSASPLTLPDPASQIAWASSGDDLATTDDQDSSGDIDMYSVDPTTGAATELADSRFDDEVSGDMPFSLQFQPGTGWLAVGESNSISETGSVAAFNTSPASAPSTGSTGSGSAGDGSGSSGSGSGSGSSPAPTVTGSTEASVDPTTPTASAGSTPTSSAPGPVLAPTIEPVYSHITTTGAVKLDFTPLGGFFEANRSTLRSEGRAELTKLWPVLRSQFAKAPATRITVIITGAGPTIKTARRRAEAVRHALLPGEDKNITFITRGLIRPHDSQVQVSLALTAR